MGFEFFFKVFGLISTDPKLRHKSRLETEWRLPAPLNANLFRDGGVKSPLSGSHMFKPSSPVSDQPKQRPIFSTSGTLAAANNVAVNENSMFSSSSSASSIASSGSTQTTSSTSAFIKPSEEQTKKYEFRLNFNGEKGASLSSSPQAASNLRLSTETVDNLAANLGAKLGGLTRMGGANEFNLDEPSSDSGSPSGTLDEQDPASVLTGIQNAAKTSPPGKPEKLPFIYSVLICIVLWFTVFRLTVGLLVEKSLLTLDFYALGPYKIHFLIPALCLAIQAASVSLLFLRNNLETNWLVPFYSSKDYLIRSRSNFKPKMEDYKKRVSISIAMALVLAFISSISLSAYLFHCVSQSDQALAQQHHQANLNRLQQQQAQYAANQYETMTTVAPGLNGSVGFASGLTSIDAMGPQTVEMSASGMERVILCILLAFDIVWAIYATYICFLVAFYFNLICSIMKARFHGISRIIEDLAESNTTKTTNQARKITTLYLEHNEACELLDESNDFWQYLIFFTYFTYIPAYCYCLYNLFFVDFETWPYFITWVIHTHTGFIILLISFSAAGVSTEAHKPLGPITTYQQREHSNRNAFASEQAHAPYTSLHTLSLIQLPLDVEVNIATFLHRVRGLTIGYSCYDLFAITNASMSNTAAACASYFLIVADFSRSSVFTLAQMNGSAAAAAATAAGATPTPA